MTYWRPIPMPGPRPRGALPLGWLWFDRVERLSRDTAPEIVPARDVPADWLDRLTTPRAPIAGVAWDQPRIMGILNVTPDSFSDGGRLGAEGAAEGAGRTMVAEGADLLDIGGESTRPGAAEVPVAEETARVVPASRALSGIAPVSVDTRKAPVAEAALAAGARIVNDVSAFGFDPAMPQVAARAEGVCLMHAQGAPATMQDDPRYDDVLLEVYDHLAQRLAQAEAAGIPRDRVMVDPGIGFGKTLDHNLALLRRVSLFHGLGAPILLGVSRKGFIGRLTGAADPTARLPGSLAVGTWAAAQGVQCLRVHDVRQTRAALTMTMRMLEAG